MKKILILLVTSFLVLAGCSSGSSSGSGTTGSDGFSFDSYQGGTNGLTMEFAEGAPPGEIRDQGKYPFSVRVLFENVGEYDIEENTAFVSLIGIDKSLLGIEDNSLALPPIMGVSRVGDDTREGGRQQVTFSNLKYTENINAGTLNQVLKAKVCYPYKTNAQSSLCLSGEAYAIYDDDESLCDLSSTRDTASSGAPIYIENFEQNPSGEDEISFQFEIVHSPTSNLGKAYKTGSFDENCEILDENGATIASQERDYVKYSVSTGLETTLELNCNNEGSNEGFAQLYNDRATVYCTQKTTGLDEQQRLVKVELDYDYIEEIQTSLTIEHAP